jgi:WD40 repeat protein
VFSPDGGHLAARDGDGAVWVWEVAFLDKGSIPLLGSKGEGGSLVFSPDGSRLAAGGDYGIVRVWEVARPAKEPLALSTGKSTVRSVVFSPDGGHLAARDGDGAVWVWDVAHPAKEPLEIQTVRDLTVSDVAFSLDGPRVATAGSDKMIRVWKAVTSLKGGGEPLKEICSWKRSNASYNLAISRDGQYVATGDDRGIVTIWDVASPDKVPRTFRGSQGRIEDVAFSPRDNHMAVVGADGTIRVFDIIRPEKEVYSLDEAKDTKEVVFSQDGLCVATVALDGKVRIWDRSKSDRVPRTYQVDITRTTTRTRTMSLAFTPDGHRLAVANTAGVMLCDATSGKEILTLKPSVRSQEYYGITFSRDGTLLAATARNAVMFWGVTPLSPEK